MFEARVCGGEGGGGAEPRKAKYWGKRQRGTQTKDAKHNSYKEGGGRGTGGSYIMNRRTEKK